MAKKFCTTGTCIPEKNYMVDLSNRIQQIINQYIESGQYFTINRARQYGKTTLLYLLEKEGEARLNKLLDMRRQLEKELASCKHVRICPYTEPSKIIISVKNTNFTGKQLYDLLREKYHLQLEMACETYALAMLSMMDTQEGIRRLVAALKDIDSESTSEKAPDFTSVSECWNPARRFGRKRRFRFWESF